MRVRKARRDGLHTEVWIASKRTFKVHRMEIDMNTAAVQTLSDNVLETPYATPRLPMRIAVEKITAFLLLCATFILFCVTSSSGQTDSSTDRLLEKGYKEYLRGNAASAAHLMNLALLQDSSLVPAYDCLARCCAELDLYEEAERIFSLGFKRDSTDVGLLDHSAKVESDWGLLTKSEAMYRRLIRLDSTHITWSIDLSQVLIQESKFKDARRVLLTALKADSNSLKLHYLLGSCYLTDKEYPSATKELEKALNIDPGYFPAIRDLAISYLQQDSLWYALHEFQQASSLQPENLNIRMNLANCYFKTKQYRTALTTLGPLEQSSYAPEAYLQEGLCYYYMAVYDSAAERIKSALKCDSTDAITHFDLGLVYMELKKYQMAIRAFNRAILLGKRELTASAYDIMGTAYSAMKSPLRAVRAYKLAIDEKPKLPRSYFNLGVLYENSFKETAKARSYYLRVLELSDRSKDKNSFYQKAAARLKLLHAK